MLSSCRALLSQSTTGLEARGRVDVLTLLVVLFVFETPPLREHVGVLFQTSHVMTCKGKGRGGQAAEDVGKRDSKSLPLANSLQLRDLFFLVSFDLL